MPIRQVAQVSLRWPVLGIVEGRFRKLRPHAPAEDEPEGPTVLCGELSRQGDLLWLDERICLSEDASLMLLDEDLDGRLVVVAGVLRRTARQEGPFDSYRQPPTLEMLDNACVMDLAGWAYYSANALGRAGYFVLGRLMGLTQALRGGLPDGRRTVAAVAIALIATTLVVVTSSFIITSNKATRRTLQGLRPRVAAPAVVSARELANGECSARAASNAPLVAETAVDLALGPATPLRPGCGGVDKALQRTPGSVVTSGGGRRVPSGGASPGGQTPTSN